MLNRLKLPAHPGFKGLLVTAFLLTALAGALLAVYAFGDAVYEVQGLSLRMAVQPAWQGQTVIDLAPFGSITAPTHQAPLELHLKIQYIGTDLANRFLQPSQDNPGILSHLRDNIPRYACYFALRQLGLAFAGAFLLVLVVWRPRLRHALGASLAVTVLLGLVLGHGLKSYDIQAFREPRYTGVIALATEVIPEPDELLKRLDEVESQTRLLIGNIQRLFTSVNGLSMLGNPEQEDNIVKVLLVSDLQSNPVGVEFIQALARNFRVQVVVDAGDLTDFGSPLEAQVAQGLADINLPYVFVAGNHDSQDTLDFMRSLPNSLVAEGQIISVAGLKILGSPDPLSAGPEVATEPEEWNRLLDRQAEQLLAGSAQHDDVDLVVVHDPRTARQLAGTYPVIVHGHTHQQNIQWSQNSVILNPGTSGAAGVRGLYADQPFPYSAIILYLKPGTGALAADTIKYDPLTDRFFIERKLFKNHAESVLQDEQPLAGQY